jgi:CDGSH-type Zn-finger protein
VSVLLGSQEPTYLWHPPFEHTIGDKAIRLYEASGGRLDPWQKLAVRVAMARDPLGAWLCFELAIIVSRQNGKGEVLIALELAWLFLLGEKLIIHSAHLFETSREHFLKVQAIIERTPAFRKRIEKIKEGRGAEEIVLRCRCGAPEDGVHRPPCDGQHARLKFMTRKGGAARGFTGGKLVMDEAMVLDVAMMAAGLPTMATREDAQVIYAGSAGFPTSTQLALIRKRGLAQEEGVGLLLWEAERPVYDEHGRLTGGDDPASPATHAKVNPAYGIRISAKSVAKEAAGMGGYDTPEFWTERLGIGEYPEDGERWEVISKEVWKKAVDHDSILAPVRPRSHFLAISSEHGVTTLAVAGKRLDDKVHFEVIARHRGTAWLLDKLLGEAGEEHAHPIWGELGLWKRLGKPRIACLKNEEGTEIALKLAEQLKDRLFTPENRKVIFPTEIEYAAACAAFVEGLRTGLLVHIGQSSTENAIAAAVKRINPEGGWRWDRDVAAEQAPIIAGTLAVWLVEKFGKRVPKSQIW